MAKHWKGIDDLTLGLLGVALAAGAASFAFLMIISGDRRPTFSGAEHLQIFARPSTLSDDRRHTLSIGGQREPPSFDTTPIGSIIGGPGGVMAPAVKLVESEQAIGNASVQREPPSFDTTSIGSIIGGPGGVMAPAVKPVKSEQAIGNASVRGIFNGRALVQTETTVVLVGPGESIPGVGKVVSIEQTLNGPRVITDAGVVSRRNY
jgi:hypothetical protein